MTDHREVIIKKAAHISVTKEMPAHCDCIIKFLPNLQMHVTPIPPPQSWHLLWSLPSDLI